MLNSSYPILNFRDFHQIFISLTWNLQVRGPRVLAAAVRRLPRPRVPGAVADQDQTVQEQGVRRGNEEPGLRGRLMTRRAWDQGG